MSERRNPVPVEVERFDEVAQLVDELLDDLANTPARSARALALKVQAISLYAEMDDAGWMHAEPPSALLASLLQDLRR